MDSICTSKDFTGFTDPYTGTTLQVRLVVVKGLGVRYQVEGAYSVATPYATRRDAVTAWSRINGVVGLRDPSKGFVCAYTGKIITPYNDSEGHKFMGGFQPELLRTRDEVLSILNKMAGKVYTPVPRERVTKPTESAPISRSQGPDISEYAEHAAAEVLEANGKRRSTTVQVKKGGHR
jgi:hypothetical protein